MIMRDGLYTSESVSAGHPDKACDYISDIILDAFLRHDPFAHVVCEAALSKGKVSVSGRFSSHNDALFDLVQAESEALVRGALAEVGYGRADFDIDPAGCNVEICLNRSDVPGLPSQGASGQGVVCGFATGATESLMPAAFELANDIVLRGDAVRRLPGSPIRSDGRCLVFQNTPSGRPTFDSRTIVSWQHDPDLCLGDVREFLAQEVLSPVLGDGWLLHGGSSNLRTHILLNPAGPIVQGGPSAGFGMAGRRYLSDTYGGAAPYGGVALSGKSPTSIDRAGAYMARYLARHVVAAKLARSCLVQIAYVIGRAEPLSVIVDTGGKGAVPDWVLSRALRKAFELTPADIIEELKLCRPIYAPTSFSGHFGKLRDPVEYPWESNPRTSELLDAVSEALKDRARPRSPTPRQRTEPAPQIFNQSDLFGEPEATASPQRVAPTPGAMAGAARTELEGLIAQRWLICPEPFSWASFHKLLQVFQISDELQPPRPLILGGWHSSSDDDKRRRLVEQLDWARENGCLLEASRLLLTLPLFMWHRDEARDRSGRERAVVLTDPWWGLGASPPEPPIPEEIANAPALEADSLAELSAWALNFQARLLGAPDLFRLDECWFEGANDVRWSQLRVSSTALAESISEEVKIRAEYFLHRNRPQ